VQRKLVSLDCCLGQQNISTQTCSDVHKERSEWRMNLSRKMHGRVVIFRLPPFMRLWSFPHSSDDWWRLGRRHTCSILLHVNDAVDSRIGEQYDEPVELKSSVLENISDEASPLNSSNITCHQLHAHRSWSTYRGRNHIATKHAAHTARIE